MNYKGFTKTLRWNGADIKATVVDAKKHVEMRRITADLIGAKQADNEYCVNANCAMRLGQSGVFPHPVLHAWFIKSTAYIARTTNARTKNGHFIVVRYHHNNWDDIKKHDRGHKFTVEKTILLRPPSKDKRLGGDRHRERKEGDHGGHRPRTSRSPEPRGVDARDLSLREWQDNQKIAATAWAVGRVARPKAKA